MGAHTGTGAETVSRAQGHWSRKQPSPETVTAWPSNHWHHPHAWPQCEYGLSHETGWPWIKEHCNSALGFVQAAKDAMGGRSPAALPYMSCWGQVLPQAEGGSGLTTRPAPPGAPQLCQ